MQRTTDPRGRRRYRTVWISDVHLGFWGSRAEALLDFLRGCECDYLYLVGDIVDLWALRKRSYWPQQHNDVVRTILGKAKHDTEVVYVPGNHDESLKQYCGHQFGNVSIRDRALHECVNGDRLLVIHGDQFDAAVASSRWLGMLGSAAYGWLLKTNTALNTARRCFGFPYWSLAGFLKHKVKNAVQYISRYEEIVAAEAARWNVAGVVCGHIHRPELTMIEGVRYLNCGDWVENCTALVEYDDGTIALLRWDESAAAPQLNCRWQPDMPRIALVTDAWRPQVNGVVRTLETTVRNLELRGHEVMPVTPGDFKTVPCPTYPEIRLALWPKSRVTELLDDFRPNAIHIATEGPLGHAARRYCLTHGRSFTTSFHTQFPEYIRLRAPVPLAWSYAYVRRFHGAAVRTLVPTASQRDRLVERGFQNLRIWARGVDTSNFHPGEPFAYDLPRPINLYMGRVAVEKNIEAFLDLQLPGSKVVIGDGPDFEKLRSTYTDAHFLGARFGRELARHLAGADVFIFPSLTDTFGLVLLEAMACGLPVAAFPVQGPIDVIDNGVSGILDHDLGQAIAGALKLSREDCIAHASRFTWESTTETFESCLAFEHPEAAAAA